MSTLMSADTPQDDNVIHVFFGADGGYRVEVPDALPRPPREDRPRSKTRSDPELSTDDPLADVYSRAEVAQLFDIPEGRLRYWARTEFLVPSARRGRRRLYTFQDLIGLRVAKGLLDSGVPQREVLRSVDAIRAALPKVVRPLSELRVVAEGSAMLVRDDQGSYEPTTGQLVLDFRVDALRRDVVRVLRAEPTERERADAYARYLEGCRLDEEESTYPDAEAAYRDALRLDPTLNNALTNLGNLRFRQGDEADAMRLYRRALDLDAEQPEALYNIGFIALDGGDAERAVRYFERALDIDPSFADAHFNLALALESCGRRREARSHWTIYLDLEPAGDWSEVARRHLCL